MGDSIDNNKGIKYVPSNNLPKIIWNEKVKKKYQYYEYRPKLKKLLDQLTLEKNDLSYKKLEEEVKLKPKDKHLRFKLAESYLPSTETEKGFNELLHIFEEDSNWNDNAAKKKLLEYFDLLGFNDPNVIKARKKLSSIMFK